MGIMGANRLLCIVRCGNSQCHVMSCHASPVMSWRLILSGQLVVVGLRPPDAPLVCNPVLSPSRPRPLISCQVMSMFCPVYPGGLLINWSCLILASLLSLSLSISISISLGARCIGHRASSDIHCSGERRTSDGVADTTGRERVDLGIRYGRDPCTARGRWVLDPRLPDPKIAQPLTSPVPFLLGVLDKEMP